MRFGTLPYTGAMLRAGEWAARLAVLNWTVFGLALLLLAITPVWPGPYEMLLRAGTAGWVFNGLIVASGMTVWVVALLLVGRDPWLSPKAWSRWSIALVALNMPAANVYVLLWWRRRRRQRAGEVHPS